MLWPIARQDSACRRRWRGIQRQAFDEFTEAIVVTIGSVDARLFEIDLYASGQAVGIHYPTGQIDAQNLANELAARLDELVSNAVSPFSQPSDLRGHSGVLCASSRLTGEWAA